MILLAFPLYGFGYDSLQGELSGIRQARFYPQSAFELATIWLPVPSAVSAWRSPIATVHKKMRQDVGILPQSCFTSVNIYWW